LFYAVKIQRRTVCRANVEIPIAVSRPQQPVIELTPDAPSVDQRHVVVRTVIGSHIRTDASGTREGLGSAPDRRWRYPQVVERIGIGCVEPDWSDTDLPSRLKEKPQSEDLFERIAGLWH
jgi:hypothetical protein